MKIQKILKKINKITLKTIYFNFKYLPFKQAMKLPFLISNKVYLLKTEGKITITGTIKPGMIEIGFGKIGIFDNKRSRSVWEVAGGVIFKGKASIGHGSKISVGADGVLELGDNFRISAESSIVAHKRIEIANNCLISWDVLIMDTDLHAIKDSNNQILNPPAEIIIGADVWIGCRNLILKGSAIPNGSIIAANSLVNKKLLVERTVFGGNPVIELKNNIRWEY